MAVKLVCDGGCGKTTDNPTDFKARGLAVKTHYCDDCVVAIDEFLKARNELHTEVARMFALKLEVLKEMYNIEHPDGKLPDER